ncbi:MAG: hypothetical protein DRR06_09320 [Gammaproteobacteria bacterium]|nr:MAG: hypothetical protein DRR42_21445 [Gammaproteobacteria bacterium]RLA44582.1 MAG: hypothetical protein DRR06_09320 [Gammaproteobacteria bacterium]
MKKILVGIALASVFASTAAIAAQYEVTITNVTEGTLFTPILVVSHTPGVSLFELGQPASEELVAVAEGGDIAPFVTALEADSRVVDTADSGDVLSPGASVTVTVEGPRNGQISLVSMLLPTNDGFIALNGVVVPKNPYRSVTYYSPGYDAGSEVNDELCDSIPAGGPCEPEVSNGNTPEAGVVHIHSGIHGHGDLVPSESDWRNPAAAITITLAH